MLRHFKHTALSIPLARNFIVANPVKINGCYYSVEVFEDVLQNARQVNLQRPGKDPKPVLLTFKPALDVIKKLCANLAAAKDGFKVKPVIQGVNEVRRGRNGRVVVDREYDHPTTGTWWAKAQAAVRIRDLCMITSCTKRHDAVPSGIICLTSCRFISEAILLH